MTNETFNQDSLTVSKGPGDIVRYPHMARVGIPFAMGQLVNCDNLSVALEGGHSLPAAFRATAHWSDGSVKWCQARIVCAGISNPDAGFILTNSDSVAAVHDDVITHDENDDTIIIKENGSEYRFSKGGDSIFPTITTNGSQRWSSDKIGIVLSDADSEHLRFEKTGTTLVKKDSVSALVEVCGVVSSSQKMKIILLFRFEVVLGKLLSVVIEIHNPNRASHTDGIWDLGDTGSFTFKEFSIRFTQAQDQVELLPEAHSSDSVIVDSNDAVLLFQASSGGINWDSPTHINAKGKCCNEFCGYAISTKDDHIATGKRAGPLVIVDSEKNYFSYSMKISQYWQNFPKSILVSNSEIVVGLFPKEHSDGHELQGGERKRHTVYFSFSDSSSLSWVDQSATILPTAGVFEQAGVLANPAGPFYKPYDDLIEVSLDDSRGIAAKREFQDEYGWRHFGDVVADHETLYHETDDIFVSHYNNQYDAVYGFARQYLLTADSRWYQLMSDLARHVLDIDIYRTSEDRAEYNHGLFWHTDHYLQASTCSHRTYSKDHYSKDWKGDKGGGPGSEHCYTTGLKLYYFLTGDEDAKETVLGLASWIRSYYEGTGTLIERAKYLITADARNLISIFRGQSVLRYRYGFDRGTGNYIRALLDSYELTLDEKFVDETEVIIFNTFGAGDDIAVRDLGNIERTWFYTVFLQEVIRYLDLKRMSGSLDASFCYARRAFLHYAQWMALHEQTTLSRSEVLDYPNDTWVAQDIRKANVLYAAYRYSNDNRDLLLARACEFRDYVVSTLSKSETLHFSRLQILLLQNHGPSGLMQHTAEPYTGMSGLEQNLSAEVSSFYSKKKFSVFCGRQRLANPEKV